MPSKNLSDAEFYKGYFRDIFAGVIQSEEGGIKSPAEVFATPGIEEYLKDELDTVVSSINSLRMFCTACEKSDDVKSLTPCDACWTTYFCGDLCRTSRAARHAKVCHHLRAEKFDQIVEMLPPACSLGWLGTKNRKATVQAKEIASWEDWVGKAHPQMGREMAAAAPKLLQWFKLTGWTPLPTEEDLVKASLNVLSNVLTTTMTIAGSIVDFKLEPRETPLVIHLPGAAGMETSLKSQNLISELSSLFPGHRSMEIVLVGPEVAGDFYPPQCPGEEDEEEREKQVVTFSKFTGLYDAFMENHVAASKAFPPDVVLAFHPGLSAASLQRSWLTSIQLMVRLNLPVVLTCYNADEFERTMAFLRSDEIGIDVNFIKAGLNPFGSRLIKQTAHALDEVFAPNMYIISFQGQK